MSEKATSVTPEELQQVQEIRGQYNNIALALGEMELRREALIDSYKELYNSEKDIYRQLGEKYGNGSINLADGTISYADTNE